MKALSNEHDIKLPWWRHCHIWSHHGGCGTTYAADWSTGYWSYEGKRLDWARSLGCGNTSDAASDYYWATRISAPHECIATSLSLCYFILLLLTFPYVAVLLLNIVVPPHHVYVEPLSSCFTGLTSVSILPSCSPNPF